MVKKSSQKDKQPHIKTRRKKTLKRKSSRKELKRTKKRKHDEEGGGFFDMFRTSKSKFQKNNRDSENKTLIFDQIFNSDKLQADFKVMMKGLIDFEVMPGTQSSNFSILKFWQHFSRIYGLCDDWRSLVGKSRLRYLLEFKFFREFMGDHFDYTGSIPNDKIKRGLEFMRRCIGHFMQKYLTEQNLKEILDKNILAGRGTSGIFGWGKKGDKFPHKKLLEDIWGVRYDVIRDKLNDYEFLAKILKQEIKTGVNEDIYGRFENFTILLIYIYHYFIIVKDSHRSGQKIGHDKAEKPTSSKAENTTDNAAKTSEQEESKIGILTTSMERLLKTGVFNDKLLNKEFRIFFISYIETQKIRTGLWINTVSNKSVKKRSINLYFLTNNISNFRFLDCLYTDEYQIDNQLVNALDSNKWVKGHDCPTEIFPKMGTVLDKEYFEEEKNTSNLNLRGISFYPMRCPNRGFKQLVSECRQLAFVNHIVSRSLNTLMNLPHNIEVFSKIIPDMFTSTQDLTLENFRRSKYTKMKLLEINLENSEAVILDSIIESLKEAFKSLRITINNGESSIGKDKWEQKTSKNTKDTQKEIYYSLKDDLKTRLKTILDVKVTNKIVQIGSSEPPTFSFDIQDPTTPPYDWWAIYDTVDGKDGTIELNKDLTLYQFFAGLQMTHSEFFSLLRTLENFLFKKVESFNLYMNDEYKKQITKLRQFYEILNNLHDCFLSNENTSTYKVNLGSELDDDSAEQGKIIKLFNSEIAKLKKLAVADFEILTISDNDFATKYFKKQLKVEGKDIFMTVEQAEKVLPLRSEIQVKIGIVFKRLGEGLNNTQKKYERFKEGYASPLPTNQELNTFQIKKDEMLLSVKDETPYSFDLQNPDELSTLEGTEWFKGLPEKVKYLKQNNDKQVYMFLYEDNKVKKKEPPSREITEEPRMSFWFES